jgi:hypothetical protein
MLWHILRRQQHLLVDRTPNLLHEPAEESEFDIPSDLHRVEAEFDLIGREEEAGDMKCGCQR